VEVSLEAAPSVTWDAVVLPDGEQAALALAEQGQVIEFVKDQYRHCKPMLVLGHASAIVAKAGIDVQLPDGTPDPGIVLGEPMDAAAPGAEVDVDGFVAALAKHRHYERETDPPRV
jgi:catalase